MLSLKKTLQRVHSKQNNCCEIQHVQSNAEHSRQSLVDVSQCKSRYRVRSLTVMASAAVCSRDRSH